LAQNNSLALLDPDKNIVDALAWGSSTNPFLEGSPFPQNPEQGKSLGRKWSTTTENYIETDNNQNDFELQTPTPRNQNQRLESQPETPPLAVVINEIAWMGTVASLNDEWIELYNTTHQTIDLTGWQLTFLPSDATTTRIISTFAAAATTTISPLSYFLLERTNDDPVDIPADQIFKGALNDDGGVFELQDSQGNLIDKVDCQRDEVGKCIGWFAGKKEGRISMERVNPRLTGTDPNNWDDNNQITINGKDVKG